MDFKEEPLSGESSPKSPPDSPESPSTDELLITPDSANVPLDVKLKDLDSKQNMRLYLMKSWNVMSQSAGNVPELSNSEIRKLLMSPPQSPSINSTSKEATSVAFTNALDEHLDSTNDSDALVMALEEENVDSIAGAAAPTLKTLKSPMNDGLYTYWAVVKTTASSTSVSAAAPNYLAKFR